MKKVDIKQFLVLHTRIMYQKVKLYTVKKVDKTHVNDVSRHKANDTPTYNVPERKIVCCEKGRQDT